MKFFVNKIDGSTGEVVQYGPVFSDYGRAELEATYRNLEECEDEGVKERWTVHDTPEG